MKRFILFITIICCSLISCNKWELINEETVYGVAECVEKNYRAPITTISPIVVNKTVTYQTRHIPARYDVIYNCSFKDYDTSTVINNKNLYATTKVNQKFSCQATKYTYFSGKKSEYKIKYKDLEISKELLK